jgi:release factor glutamine methyltransferase
MTTATVGTALDEGASVLRQAGIVHSRWEAGALWAGLAGGTLGSIWLQRNAITSAEVRERFWAAVRRRAAGEPCAYVAGRAGFRTLDLAVDRRVLIPRPETEGLVERVLAWSCTAERGDTGLSAADIGTGSGCIALSLAVEGHFSRIVATDQSPEALAVAAENLRCVAPKTPVDFRVGNLLSTLGDGESFDVIVANPPYVAADEFAALDASIRVFEPRAALVSSERGLAHTRQILQNATRHVVPGGLLAIEVDSRRADETLAIARQASWCHARVESDLFGRPRYLLANRSTKS